MSYNSWLYAYAEPINHADPTGWDPSSAGAGYFALCFDIHTTQQYFNPPPGPNQVTVQQALDWCGSAYRKENWINKFYRFDLHTSYLPRTAHDLMGWFLYNKRLDGTNNSDRLFFDASEPLTRELARGVLINEVRHMYYNRENTNGPTEYPYTSPEPVLATGWFGLRDTFQSVMEGKVSLSLGLFMGSFYYQVKTTDGRVGFRIDNDTTLASGSHIAGRGAPLRESLEELVHDDETLKNRPVRDIIREHPQLISILSSRTKEEAPTGGGNLYQTYTWTEKYDCSLSNLLPQNVWTYMLDLGAWSNFREETVDPPGFPAQ